MKKHLLAALPMALVFATSIHAQNVAPFWSLSGNSNAAATSKLGTTNNIPLRLFTNNLERARIDGTGKIGINTTAPKGQLSIQSSGGAPAASWVTSGVPIFAGFGENTPGNADHILAMGSNTASARAVFLGRKSRGTLAAPTAVQNNDYLLSLYSSGYDGGSFQAPATVDFFVDGAVSSGHVPTRISLSTGSAFGDRTERLKVGSTGNVDINAGQLFVKQSNGYVGIGTASPTAKLHVAAGNEILDGDLDINGNINVKSDQKSIQFASPGSSPQPMMFMFPSGTVNTDRMVIAHSPSYTTWGLQYNDVSDRFDFLGAGSSRVSINLSNGNVGVGVTTPAYKLEVCGTIRAKEVRVETGWCDYVFNKTYKLKSLQEVEKYIDEHKHLPGIAPATEVEKDGLKVGEMSKAMMEKIEELTLYVIELNKENKKLQQQVDELKDSVVQSK